MRVEGANAGSLSLSGSLKSSSVILDGNSSSELLEILPLNPLVL